MVKCHKSRYFRKVGLACNLAKESEKAGADAISSIPTLYYNINENGIFKHYSMISTAASLPFFAYIIPALTGFNVNIELAKRLSQVRNFAGFKYTAFDIYRIPFLKRAMGKGGVVFTGCDEFCFQGLTLASSGSIGINMNLIPSAFIKIYELFRSGKFAEAIKLQADANELMVFLLNFKKSPAPHKFVLKLLGFDVGGVRPPIEGLRPQEEKKVVEYVKNCEIIKKYGLKE